MLDMNWIIRMFVSNQQFKMLEMHFVPNGLVIFVFDAQQDHI